MLKKIVHPLGQTWFGLMENQTTAGSADWCSHTSWLSHTAHERGTRPGPGQITSARAFLNPVGSPFQHEEVSGLCR